MDTLTTSAAAQIAATDPLTAVRHANLANAITGVYGLSGSGKSSLADTAAEYAWRLFGMITLAYTADLGGYGTKRLALIRRGIIITYDPGNHVNFYETMELISRGAFPRYLLPGGPATQDERDRGWAPPDCELVLPVRDRWQFVCPNGHRVGNFYTAAAIVQAGVVTCDCGHACSASDPATKVEQQVVKSAGFGHVGHRIYDSMTAINEMALADLQAQSAKGMLPVSGERGGSVLGGADALVSGTVKYGTSSKGQYGFAQTRTHGWLTNIKAISGHVIPPTMTFMVEMSKGDDESGGQPVFGPKIAGNARTSTVPGWLGNCVHAVREPQSPSTPTVMVHRLWLRNHVDELDLRRVPYLAKTRGVPGLPDYLEDAPGRPAWETCSLDKLYTLIAGQVAEEEARLAVLYPAAPITQAAGAPEVEEVISTNSRAVPLPSGPRVQHAGVPTAPGGSLPPQVAVAGGARRRVASVGAPPPPPAPAATPTAPIIAPAPAAPGTGQQVAAPAISPAGGAAGVGAVTAGAVGAPAAPAPPRPPGVPAPAGRRVPRPPV